MAIRKPPLAILADDGTELLFDGVTEYGVDRSVTVTEHTVESGANISDHARSNPTKLTATVRVTASPWGGGGAGSLIVGGQRLDAATGWLDAHARQRVTIVSARFGTMASMILTRWPTKATVMEHLDFQLEAVQVVEATAGLVDIPADAPATEEAAASLPDEVDVGEQATTATDDSASTSATSTTTADEVSQEEADMSVMLDILTSLGIEP